MLLVAQKGTLPFSQVVRRLNPDFLYPSQIQTLQVNVGNLCNQSCVHCHVSASPQGRNQMQLETFEDLLAVMSQHSFAIVDITGGAPEMNVFFRNFVDRALAKVQKVIVRTNLTVFFEPQMEDLPKWYADRGVTLVASLPCYHSENVDAQRGKGVFDKSIRALQQLNQEGYGKDWELNLVYNPLGDALPGDQKVLEEQYRQQLWDHYGICFSHLFVLANLPVGRFKHYLRHQGRLESYTQMLADHLNPHVVESVMCRSLLSIDWQGYVYHCDFNQQEGWHVRNKEGHSMKIKDILDVMEQRGEIITGQHCYGCTAGSGSSCTGALFS